jgi:hypothetical protein
VNPRNAPPTERREREREEEEEWVRRISDDH